MGSDVKLIFARYLDDFMLQTLSTRDTFFLPYVAADDVTCCRYFRVERKHWSASALIPAPWIFSETRELSTSRVYIREIFHFTELNCIRITSISAEPWTKQVSVAGIQKIKSTIYFFDLPVFLMFSIRFVTYFTMMAGGIMHSKRPTPPSSKLLLIHLSLLFPTL